MKVLPGFECSHEKEMSLVVPGSIRSFLRTPRAGDAAPLINNKRLFAGMWIKPRKILCRGPRHGNHRTRPTDGPTHQPSIQPPRHAPHAARTLRPAKIMHRNDAGDIGGHEQWQTVRWPPIQGGTVTPQPEWKGEKQRQDAADMHWQVILSGFKTQPWRHVRELAARSPVYAESNAFSSRLRNRQQHLLEVTTDATTDRQRTAVDRNLDTFAPKRPGLHVGPRRHLVKPPGHEPVSRAGRWPAQ